ncbi:MAG: YitT family protein [Alistipes sp.]|nr:YitT family protein [Alistipes sp.]
MKVKLSLQDVLVGIKEYILMTFGMFCYAFGWQMCVLPAGGMGGGAAGLATLINAVLSSTFPGSEFIASFLTIGNLIFAINCVLLILGVMIVGWKFGIKTLYCILMMSVMFNLVSLMPADTMVKMVVGVDSWRILLVAMGAASCGVGIAVSFMQGGSTGGTDIVAMIINKFRTVSYGKVLLMTDCGILIGSLFLTTAVNMVPSSYDIAAGELIELVPILPFSPDAFARMIYGFMMIAVIGYTVDFVQSGNQQSNQIMIFCKDYEGMAEMIKIKANRGATLIDAMGWYTKTPSKAVMVVCRKRDTSMILKLVREQDPNAFLTVGSVMGVYGQGFDALNKL